MSALLGLDYATSDDDELQEPTINECEITGDATATTARTTTQDEEDGLDGLPAEPPGAAAPEVQARIARFLDMQRVSSSQDQCAIPRFQTSLQSKKEVANPYILDKVVAYFGIDELHSNFSRDVFDPHGLALHEFSDHLVMEQKRRADERQQQQLARTRSHIPFVSAKQPSA
ncbi:hypothetical protein ATCC90586_008529 [Pythium insidiosum]|nr:hypothetical protein ATCC90586_008529 [Pythium insidiosum]